jgi:ABC-type Fe3+-hydroxamate transport system substrate-binding protein
MGEELKSTLDIVMGKLKGRDTEAAQLSEAQKQRIAEIKRTYEAKIAESKILVTDKEKLAVEIVRLEEKRESEIEKVYKDSSAG